jgi:plastocyanin
MRRSLISFATTALAALAACGGESARPSADSPATPAPPAEAPPAPAATGDTIIVKLLTDEAGNNRFEPAEIEAEKGDLIRFTLETGVHNVHFLADSNAIKTNLPAASELLQLPGQTYDLVVALEPGTYYFQCDPHALLGMQGHLKVEAEN